MLENINLPLILIAALLGSASPGHSTLAIAGTSMNSGRRRGLAFALGVCSGSWFWSISAAFGLGAFMLANVWLFDILRYFGAAYLLFLAYKSARSAFKPSSFEIQNAFASSARSAYAKGIALHLTNPKAILFFGSLFSIGIPQGTSPQELMIVICAVGTQSILVFTGYAFLFSSPRITAGYIKLKRWFEGVFALAFGAVGLKILSTPLD